MVYIYYYRALELRIEMKVNDPRSFYRYLLSSKYGQKNSGLNGDSNPDLYVSVQCTTINKLFLQGCPEKVILTRDQFVPELGVIYDPQPLQFKNGRRTSLN